LFLRSLCSSWQGNGGSSGESPSRRTLWWFPCFLVAVSYDCVTMQSSRARCCIIISMVISASRHHMHSYTNLHTRMSGCIKSIFYVPPSSTCVKVLLALRKTFCGKPNVKVLGSPENTNNVGCGKINEIGTKNPSEIHGE